MPHITDKKVAEVQTDYLGHGYGASSQEAACVGVHFTMICSFDEADISMTDLTHDGGYQRLCSASGYGRLIYLSLTSAVSLSRSM